MRRIRQLKKRRILLIQLKLSERHPVLILVLLLEVTLRLEANDPRVHTRGFSGINPFNKAERQCHS